MKCSVTVDFKPKKLLVAYGLGSSQRGQKYLARRVRQRMDKYVPKDTGLLKNTAKVSSKGETITYVQPYARKQFYVNYRHADPKRGPQWHRRMLRAEGKALRGELQAYLERRPG